MAGKQEEERGMMRKPSEVRLNNKHAIRTIEVLQALFPAEKAILTTDNNYKTFQNKITRFLSDDDVHVDSILQQREKQIKSERSKQID